MSRKHRKHSPAGEVPYMVVSPFCCGNWHRISIILINRGPKIDPQLLDSKPCIRLIIDVEVQRSKHIPWNDPGPRADGVMRTVLFLNLSLLLDQTRWIY